MNVIEKSTGRIIATGVDSLIGAIDMAVALGEDRDRFISRIDLKPFAHAEMIKAQRFVSQAAEKARALIGPALLGERADLIAKAETAERVAGGRALPGDVEALKSEAIDRGETVDVFASLVAAKARWARIMALEISRRVNLKTDEIKAIDLSTAEAIEGLLPSLSGFEPDLRLAIAEMQVKARIAYASAKLLLLNPEKDSPECWTASGKPAVDKLSELVGFEVTAAQRDAVWEIEGK